MGTDELEHVFITNNGNHGRSNIPYRMHIVQYSLNGSSTCVAWLGFCAKNNSFLCSLWDMSLKPIDNDGDSSISVGGGLLLKQCRVLDKSNCTKVMPRCVEGTPEPFFAEQWGGVPLSMEPNFETGSVSLKFWGRNIEYRGEDYDYSIWTMFD